MASKPYWSLVTHRKKMMSRELELAPDFLICPRSQTNEESLAAQMRQMEAERLAKQVNRLSEEQADLLDAGDESAAEEKVVEAHDLNMRGLDILMETIQSVSCDPDGKPVELEKLKQVITAQDEAVAVLNALSRAAEVDPQPRVRSGNSQN